MTATRSSNWKVTAAILICGIGVLTVYLWPRVATAITLLSHDALARELMQDGWLEESRQLSVTIQRYALAASHRCNSNEFVEWDDLILAYDDSIFNVVEATPHMVRLLTIDDRIQITLMESSIGLVLRPLDEHPRLAKQFNARFESSSRFDVLLDVLQSGERSPFFTTPSSHFEREWLTRMKAMALRAGSEYGVWVVDFNGAQALVPRTPISVIGIDLYIDGADRFVDVVIRGAADSSEAIESLRCLTIKPAPE